MSINYDDLFLEINYYYLAEIVFKCLLEYDEDNDKYTKRKEITNQYITITDFPYKDKYEFLKKLVKFIKNSKDDNGNFFLDTNGTMKSNQEQIKSINNLINFKKKDYIKIFNDPQNSFKYP
jgi:hypothetical protein